MSELEYTSLTTIDGLTAVRKRPGMYVGSTTIQDGKAPRGLMHLIQEALSNSADEVLAGFGDRVLVQLYEDGSISIQDFGRGIPYGKKGDDAIRGFTVLHTSGKFDSSAYRKSGGMHGVGLKAITALSEYVEVDVTTASESYHLKLQQETVLENTIVKPKGKITGTKIRFLPDVKIFETIEWDIDEIKKQLDALAYLTQGVIYELHLVDGETITYHHDDGINDLVKMMSGEAEVIGMTQPLRMNGLFGFKTSGNKKDVAYVGKVDESFKGDIIDVDISLQYIEDVGEQIKSFANAIPTTQGGPHENGLKRALYHVVTEYAQNKKLLKRNETLEMKDTRDGLVAVISIGIPESLIEFESQTKEKLGTAGADDAVYDLVVDQFTKWLYDHDKEGLMIIEKMLDARHARVASADARKLARAARKSKGNEKEKLLLSTKFTDAQSQDPQERELFIVEGDSAAGSANRARDPEYQAILPIRGKILNVMDQKAQKVLGNLEVSTILNVLDCGFKNHFDEERLDFHKVIIMTDADDDGSHITALLITLFWLWVPQLIEGGYLYIANAPLYRFDRYVKGERELAFALNREEYEQMLPQYEGWKVTRLKGLGEMNDKDLRITTMHPDTRQLYRVTVSDAKQLSDTIELLMGKKRKNGLSAAEARRQWFEDHIQFGTEEDL